MTPLTFPQRIVGRFAIFFRPNAGYVTLMVIGALTSFSKLFLLGRMLDRNGFGQYTYLAIFVQYAIPFASFGILDGLSRRYPLLLGSGRIGEAKRLRNACLGEMVLAGSALLAIAVTAAAFIQAVSGHKVTLPVSLVGLDVLAMSVFFFGIREIRSRLHLTTYAAMIAGRSMVDLLTALVVAPRFGVVGVLVGEIIVSVLMASVLFRWFIQDASILFGARKEVVVVIREGLLIGIGGIFTNTALMADRLILGSLIPKSDFALYSFHMLVVNAALIASNVIYQFVTPRLLHLYGERNDYNAVLAFLGRISLTLLALSSVCALVFPWVFGRIAAVFFPMYTIDTYLLAVVYIAATIEVMNLFPIALLVLGRLWTLIYIHAAASALVILLVIFSAERTHTLLTYGLIFLAGRLFAWLASFSAAMYCRRIAVQPS